MTGRSDGNDNRGRLLAALSAIEALQARLEKAERGNSEPIAIVGIGCRFPGDVNDARSYWRALREGQDLVREVPKERWDIDAYYSSDPAAPGKIVTREAGCLSSIDLFDPQFFGLSAKEAAEMDPQQRLALEVAKEALDDAGVADATLAGSPTGVFLGVTESEYAWLQHADLASADSYTSTGLYGGITANRISYFFDLKGPSFTVDSICSSSLLAIHLAVESLRRGECSTALAGGVCVLTGPDQMIWLSKLGTVSPGGRCRAFAADADGIVLGEGCGIVVLKTLSQALANRDRVYAVIRGTGVSQDGKSNGLTAPSRAGQEAMLRQAYAHAGVAPSTVDYVDAHGTGTALGDPIEAAALGTVLGAGRTADRPCYLGSAKTNLAHLGPVGGVASLIKTALALQHRELPPSLHFGKPNPHIAFDELKLKVVDRLRPWPSHGDQPAIAGVSSLAFGGTNVHVVLGEHRQAPADRPAMRRSMDGAVLLPISAANGDALKTLGASYGQFLAVEGSGLGELAAAAACRRSHHAFRAAFVGDNARTFVQGAAALAEGRRTDGLHQGMAPLAGRPKVAFVFSGHGGQYAGMCRRLLATCEPFRRSLESSDQVIRALTGWSAIDRLETGDGADWLHRMDIVQPVLFAIQVAMAAMWRSFGIEPHAVIGSSVGEVAAAHTAGHLSLADGAQIVCERSRLLERLSGRGAMGFVELSSDAARAAIKGFEAQLDVAVINGSRSCVLSGDPAALDEVLGRLERRDVFCRKVDVTIASHSPQMDELREPLRKALARITPMEGDVSFYSTVENEVVDGSTLDGEYWVRNLRAPVRFGDGISGLASRGVELFVEIGPHPLVTQTISEVLRDSRKKGIALPTLHRDQPEGIAVLNSLAELYVRGCDPDWTALYPDAEPVPLPSYPWQRQRLWLRTPEKSTVSQSGPSTGADALLSHRRESAIHPGEFFWDISLDIEANPWLSEHKVLGRSVVPAAAMIVLATRALHALDERPCVLSQVEFVAAIDIQHQVQLAIRQTASETFEWKILARESDRSAWQVCATGRADPRARDLPAVPESGDLRDFSIEEHYRSLEAVGGHYGPSFKRITALSAGEDAACATIASSSGQKGVVCGLDAALQAALALLPTGDGAVPSKCGLVMVDRSALREGDWLVRVHKHEEASPHAGLVVDVEVLRADGERIAMFAGLQFQALQSSSRRLDRLFHEISWERIDAPKPADAHKDRWLIFADNIGVGDALAAELRAKGNDCTILRRPAAFAFEHTVDALMASAESTDPVRGIVYAWPLDGGPEEEAIERDCRSLLRLLQQAAKAGESPSSQLFVLTAGAQPLDTDATIEPQQSMLWGLGRVAMLEQPRLRCCLIDLAGEIRSAETERLAAWLVADRPEQQIALRGSEFFAARCRPANLPDPMRSPANGRPFQMLLSSPGRLEALEAIAFDRRPPADGEVEVKVAAAALNFMDVLRGLGVLRFGTSDEPLQFGLECVGEITAIGTGVTGLRVGDRVVALTREPRCLATHVVTPATLVVPMPDMPVAAAASVPIAYMTAAYALEDAARLVSGEHVLIHAATGGVGLAALAIARRKGAIVHATAGSEAKREYLRNLGVEHVHDSRSLDFVEEIRKATGGRGVDVVLNSLSGDAMRGSMSLLAPFGRFVEIGKRDQQEGTLLELEQFARSLSYVSVDLARLLRERSDMAGQLLMRVMSAVADGGLPELPCLEVPVADAARAFRQFARAEHIGKFVVSFSGAENMAVARAENAPLFSASGSYLITGAFGGLGRRLASWLAEEGAGELVLVGRREPDEETRQSLAEIERLGVPVETHALDVADDMAMERLFGKLATKSRTLKGIFHLAAVGDDALLPELDWRRFETVFAPKVRGAQNLDRLSRGFDLDHFVMFSSTASTLGTAGQANYAAANAFLDGLAARRRGLGLSGQSIAWGPWGEIGGAAERDLDGRFSARGLTPIRPQQGFAALKKLLARPAGNVMVASFDAGRWAGFYPTAAHFVDGTAPKSDSMAAGFEQLSPDERRHAMVERLRHEVSVVLGVATERIDTEATAIGELGLDSLMSLELRSRLEVSLGLKLSATLIWNHPTFTQLADYLLERLGLLVQQDEHDLPSTQEEENGPLDVDAMSEEAAEAMLLERLNEISEQG